LIFCSRTKNDADPLPRDVHVPTRRRVLADAGGIFGADRNRVIELERYAQPCFSIVKLLTCTCAQQRHHRHADDRRPFSGGSVGLVITAAAIVDAHVATGSGDSLS
jgi:hypothetical protein